MATLAVSIISYEDLVSFDPTSSAGIELMERIGEAFGPNGMGILAVRNVPDFESKRQILLPLASKLPTIPDMDSCVVASSMYSIGWSHGKEALASGKRDVWKGSFYANPFAATNELPNVWPDDSLPQLKPAILEMSNLIHKVGCLLAKVCDAYCQRQLGTTTSIEKAIQASRDTKARLLHYFSAPSADAVLGDSWCAWHNDHGCLTGLVPGMYIQDGKEVSNPDINSGLFIQTRNGVPVKAVIPSGCCAFQIGESSQILSGGRLQATPHAVFGTTMPNVTRESFALFLQPNQEFVLDLPTSASMDDLGTPVRSDIERIQSRWTSGQTFGDFHWATIKKFVVKD